MKDTVTCYVCKHEFQVSDVTLCGGKVVCLAHAGDDSKPVGRVELESAHAYKYVRMNDGRVLFRRCSIHSKSHKQMATDDGGTPVSAGIIGLSEEYYRITERMSMSLNLYSAPDDEDVLFLILGVPYRNETDWWRTA